MRRLVQVGERNREQAPRVEARPAIKGVDVVAQQRCYLFKNSTLPPRTFFCEQCGTEKSRSISHIAANKTWSWTE